MFKNRYRAVKSAIAAGALVPALALAQATGPDLSGMTDQIDWSSAIAGVLLIAGGLAGVYVVIRAAKIIMSMIKGG